MISVGKTEEGRPICKLLKPQAYFATYNDAYEALMAYHRDSSTADVSNITVKELIDEWLDYKEKSKIADNTLRNYRSICNKFESIYGMLFRDVTKATVRNIIASIDRPSPKHFARIVFSLLFEYATEHDYVKVNIMNSIGSDKITNAEMKENYKGHKGFTREEVDLLWKNIDVPFVNIILIQCYTGFRPQEMCKLIPESVNLKNLTITGGMKTTAGKDRIVPICEKISILVESAYKDGSLFTTTKYLSYLRAFRKALNEIGIDGSKHAAHDPRVFFITNCKECGVDEYAIKRLVGHTIDDLTERIYTKRTIDWLRDEVNKLK